MEATAPAKSINFVEVKKIISHAITSGGFEPWEGRIDWNKLTSIQTAFRFLTNELKKYRENLDDILYKPNQDDFDIFRNSYSRHSVLKNGLKQQHNKLNNIVIHIRKKEKDNTNKESLDAIDEFLKFAKDEITTLSKDEKKDPCTAGTMVILGLVSAVALSVLFNQIC